MSPENYFEKFVRQKLEPEPPQPPSSPVSKIKAPPTGGSIDEMYPSLARERDQKIAAHEARGGTLPKEIGWDGRLCQEFIDYLKAISIDPSNLAGSTVYPQAIDNKNISAYPVAHSEDNLRRGRSIMNPEKENPPGPDIYFCYDGLLRKRVDNKFTNLTMGRGIPAFSICIERVFIGRWEFLPERLVPTSTVESKTYHSSTATDAWGYDEHTYTRVENYYHGPEHHFNRAISLESVLERQILVALQDTERLRPGGNKMNAG